MSAQVTITQLPTAGAITGTELVPIVQNGQTVQTTTSAISSSPNQTQTFLTKNQEPTLANSRYLSTNSGITLTDGGAQSFYQISLSGAVSQLNALGGGIVVKDSSSTLINRSIATSGAGLSVSNADGTGGNPTLALSGVAASVAALSGNGMLAMTGGGTTVSPRIMTGVANQITITNGDGASGAPIFGIADNAQFPGTGAVTVPNGTTAQKPAGASGQIRYNTDSQVFEGYANGAWNSFTLAGGVSSFSAGSTGLAPATATTGVVVLSGTLNVSSGGTGANTLTGYVKGTGTTPMTASATIPSTDITGLGTMSTQNASAVAITGGTASGLTITGSTINSSVIGASSAAAGTFTNVAMTTGTITTAPTTGNDIVNKDYADAIASGINFPQSCRLATTTNFGWTTPDDTALVKDGASAIRSLGSAIDASMAELKGGTTGQVLSKNSNTDMDFTWVAQDDSNAIQNAIVDAKGDLITATAADTPARLAVGTNGQYLIADSTTATTSAK